ncbi:MAG: flagellar protein FlgN [Pseudomonadota bacterium]
MIPLDKTSEIADSLATQAELAQRLLELLKGEYQSLAHLDGETLQSQLIEKQQLIDALETLHQEFQGLATEVGCPVRDKISMERLIEVCDSEHHLGLVESWKDMSDALASCQRQNEINGMVIVLGHQSMQNVLASLQGLPPGSVLYDTHGQTRVPSAHNVLAKV